MSVISTTIAIDEALLLSLINLSTEVSVSPAGITFNKSSLPYFLQVKGQGTAILFYADATGSSIAIGIGTGTPTAYLHLKAGTATAKTAPLKLTTGVNLTTPEDGAIEYDGTYLYYTDSTPTRRALGFRNETISIQTGATYTVLATDDTIVCNRASAMTVTLPAATGSGKKYTIKNINTGVVTIDGNAAETIDGDATQDLNQWDCAQIIDYAAGTWAIV